MVPCNTQHTLVLALIHGLRPLLRPGGEHDAMQHAWCLHLGERPEAACVMAMHARKAAECAGHARKAAECAGEHRRHKQWTHL